MTLLRPTIVLFDMDGTTVRHIHPRLLQILESLDDAGHKIAKVAYGILKHLRDQYTAAG